MPTEFLQEYIGLACQIIFQDGMGEVAELIAIEGEWIKLREGGNEALVNTRLVRSISPMPEKYQEKYQEKYRRKQNR